MFRNMHFTNIQKTHTTKMSPLTMPENVITEMSKEKFAELLTNNTGALIIKFGAEWCGPCKKIDPLVYDWMSKASANPKLTCAIIDIDDNFDIYAFLKNKKQVNGVPAILCYKMGNLTWVPDASVVGADENQIQLFFQKCIQYAV